MAGIQSIGVKLIKTLGNGRKVITETAGNKTFTKVFDSYGNLLTDRTKTIEKAIVGNKKVITKSETRLVNTFSLVDNRPYESLAFKYKSDRVYDKSGKLLGMRETENAPGRVFSWRGQNPLEHMPNEFSVTKSVPNGNKVFSYSKQTETNTPAAKSYVKDFIDNKITRKFKTKNTDNLRHEYSGIPIGSRKSQYNNTNVNVRDAFDNTAYPGWDLYSTFFGRGGGGAVKYNSKGLPLPQSYHNCEVMDYNKLQNMSLKDMRNEWLKANSRYDKYNARYAEYNMNMDFLDIPYHLAKK